MSIPPPPPPEPPKVEIKGEPAAKPVKPTPKEEPKADAKEAQTSKGKSAKDTLSKFFRPKVKKKTKSEIFVLRAGSDCQCEFEALLGVEASKDNGASASRANTAAGVQQIIIISD